MLAEQVIIQPTLIRRSPMNDATAGALVTEEFMVPSGDPGIEIFVRNKRRADLARYAPGNIVLFVHGATYPAETSFDLKLEGLSWMEFIAGHGYDVYLMDVRGFGRSARPREMDEPPEKNPPVARTATAAADLGAVVDFILRRRGVTKLCLLAWSWGTRITGYYTAAHNDKVHRLALYAPGWLRTSPSMTDTGGPLGAYRTVTVEAAKKRKRAGVPPEKVQELMPDAWFDAWASATFATDPVGARQNPPVLRAPNGSVQDNREFWSAGKPQYDPAAIRVPTFLIVAEWDADNPPAMSQALFAALTGAPYKRLVLIGEGTHSVMIEKNRMQLFREVQLFLDEPG
jgi:pimeloyl-ACP methyl ester carboxylesterase